MGYNGLRLGIGGFSSKENKGMRVFSSAAVAKRHDAVTLATVDDIIVTIHGHINRSRTHENGFPPEVYDHFVIGFPYYWEEFATLSFESEATIPTGSCKTPPTADAPSCDNPKRARSKTPSKSNQSQPQSMVQRSGPMTRSRSKLRLATGSN